jgi:hypothetical protein
MFEFLKNTTAELEVYNKYLKYATSFLKNLGIYLANQVQGLTRQIPLYLSFPLEVLPRGTACKERAQIPFASSPPDGQNPRGFRLS